MDYVLDFARAITGVSSSRGAGRGRRRGAAGALAQLRIAILGVMLGLSLPMLRAVDWDAVMPGGIRVELPRGGKVTWPAGEIGLSSLTRILPFPVPASGGERAGPAAAAASTTVTGMRFARCGRGVAGDCVVDGDTFRMAGTKVRIADIDTPETHPARCAREARLGERATERLRTLLNAGPVTLVVNGRAEDRYGRALRIVERDGVSLGQTLIDEGLARHWEGRRRPWC